MASFEWTLDLSDHCDTHTAASMVRIFFSIFRNFLLGVTRVEDWEMSGFGVHDGKFTRINKKVC